MINPDQVCAAGKVFNPSDGELSTLFSSTATKRGDRGVMSYAVAGHPSTPSLERFVVSLGRALGDAGFERAGDPAQAELVLNVIDPERPKPFRRHSRGTFLAALHERPASPSDVLGATYPLLVRALANLVLCYVPTGEVWFTTMERGAYVVRGDGDADLAGRVLERLAPLARARLVIDNEFRTDLDPELWDGDELTEGIRLAGIRLGELDLLPSPFPTEGLLNERDLRHVKRLYGIAAAISIAWRTSWRSSRVASFTSPLPP